jgi:HSP20 family protein
LVRRGKEEKEVQVMLSPLRGSRGFWDPVSEMNRVLDQMISAPTRRQDNERVRELAEWAPSLDVLSKDGDLVVRAELPGVKQEDVDITLHDRVLTISGERKAEQEEERGGYYVRERRYGSFSRSLTLPEGIDESKIHARYENGILEVTLKGAAVVHEPKRIQIEDSTD